MFKARHYERSNVALNDKFLLSINFETLKIYNEKKLVVSGR